jgi:THO complex subunit 2
MQGPDDALFCARFVEFLHEKETPGFSTLHFFDALIIVLSRSLFCLTEGETACASILLSEIWKIVSKWRYDDTAFEEELAGKPGSFMVVTADDGESDTVTVTKEDYRNLYNKWHAAIGSACVGCLESSEYMHLRNCLVVLTRMVEDYPTRPGLANKLLKALEPLQEESNSLPDIRASAQAYSMQLVKARAGGVWKEEDAATVRARMEKEQAAAEERHKKAQEQMAEIKRDQEKITEEIGDSRDRDRGRGRGGPPSNLGSGKSFEPSIRGRDDRGDDRDRRRTDDRRGVQPPPITDRRVYDRGSVGNSYASIGSGSGVRREEGPPRREEGPPRREEGPSTRGLEGRWQRAGDREPPPTLPRGGGGRGSKRSRPSSPVEQGEAREDQLPPSKRGRANQEPADEVGRADDGSRIRRLGGRRRHAGRR